MEKALKRRTDRLVRGSSRGEGNKQQNMRVTDTMSWYLVLGTRYGKALGTGGRPTLDQRMCSRAAVLLCSYNTYST